MNQALQPKLGKYLYWSLVFHSCVFIFFVVWQFFSSGPKRTHDEKIEWVQVPKGLNDEWGDPVKKSEGLPQTTIQEQKKAMESPQAGEQAPPEMAYKPPEPQKIEPPKPPVKPEPAQPKLPVEPKKPMKPVPRRRGHPQSAIQKALARVQKQVATKNAPPEAGQTKGENTGGFSYGNTTGPYVPPNDPEYVLYQAKVRHRIMGEWILPAKYTETNSGLICRVIVHINDRGEVTHKEWELQSGDQAFDLSALRAIERASPLEVPPERLKYEVYNEGFIVEFKPHAAAQ